MTVAQTKKTTLTSYPTSFNSEAASELATAARLIYAGQITKNVDKPKAIHACWEFIGYCIDRGQPENSQIMGAQAMRMDEFAGHLENLVGLTSSDPVVNSSEINYSGVGDYVSGSINYSGSNLNQGLGSGLNLSGTSVSPSVSPSGQSYTPFLQSSPPLFSLLSGSIRSGDEEWRLREALLSSSTSPGFFGDNKAKVDSVKEAEALQALPWPSLLKAALTLLMLLLGSTVA